MRCATVGRVSDGLLNRSCAFGFGDAPVADPNRALFDSVVGLLEARLRSMTVS
jgi:hypothetical protein